MRGVGNPIRKPEKIIKTIDNPNTISSLNNNSNQNPINNNNLQKENNSRIKTSSQDQNKKTKAYLNINSKIKSQNNISPLTTNLNNLIITNQNYNNAGNVKTQLNNTKNSNINQKSGKKSLTNNNNNNNNSNSSTIKECNSNNANVDCYDNKNLFDNCKTENQSKSKESCKGGEKDNQEKKDFNSSENFFIQNKKTNMYLENIYEYNMNKSPNKKPNYTNYNNYNNKVQNNHARDSFRGIKHKYELDDFQNLNLSKENEENLYQGKLTDNNTFYKVSDNPFEVNPNCTENTDENVNDKNYFKKDSDISINRKAKENFYNINNTNTIEKEKNTITTKKVSETSNNNSNKVTNINPSDNASNKGNIEINKISNKLNSINTAYTSNVFNTNNSNTSPNVNSSGNINYFNKNNKAANTSNLNKMNSYKQFSNLNPGKYQLIGLNFIGNKDHKNLMLNDMKDETYNCQTNSNSVSPNNFLFSNQNKANFSTNNSLNSNALKNSNFNFQNQICHTQENEQIKENESITVNYSNTNPNETDNLNILQSKIENTNLNKIKEKEFEKFSLKNNSLNKILKMKNEQKNLAGNSQFTNDKNYDNNTNSNNANYLSNNNGTNSNILSTYHTDNNLPVSSAATKSVNINKKNILSMDLNSEKTKITNNLNNGFGKNSNLIDVKDVKESAEIFKSINLVNSNENFEEEILQNKNFFAKNSIVNKNENLNNGNIATNRDNPNRISNNFDKNKKIGNKSGNNSNIGNVNNLRNSKDFEKNNMISSYNNKNFQKDKVTNLNLLNSNNLTENMLKNFNYVSLGYLNNGNNISNKNSNKNKISEGKYTKNLANKEEDRSKSKSLVKDKQLANSNSAKDIKNKENANNKITNQNFNDKNKENKEKDNKENKENKGNSNINNNNIPITKSCNIKKQGNKNTLSNHMINKKDGEKSKQNLNINLQNINTINGKTTNLNSKEKNTPEISPNFVKKEVCRIFYSDDFYDRSRINKLQNQEFTNNINTIKLNSLYTKNLSSKINHSKNIQIDLYNLNPNALDDEKLYNLDFNSGLKNKEKTIIIDDIDLQDEYFKIDDRGKNKENLDKNVSDNNGKIIWSDKQNGNENIQNNIIIRNVEKVKSRPQYNSEKTEELKRNIMNEQENFKSNILDSILNFKGFFKTTEKNLMENIYQSQESVQQLNKLNEKLHRLKNPKLQDLENKEKNQHDQDELVKIRESPFKPENTYYLSHEKNSSEKYKNIPCDTDRNFHNFSNSKFNTNSKEANLLGNKDSRQILETPKVKESVLLLSNNYEKNNLVCGNSNKISNSNKSKKDESDKKNILNEIHFNSDVRMKRYEILLEFINTNMKEIEQMVSGSQTQSGFNSANKENVSKIYETEKIAGSLPTKTDEINFNLLSGNNFNNGNEKKNNNYISYINSLKKIEETNSNKVSSLHSKINLNSRLSNNDILLDDSELNNNNILHIPNSINHFNKNEPINQNYNSLKNVKDSSTFISQNTNKELIFSPNHQIINDYDSNNFHKNKKDPGSSLLISSIYSDFYQDIIDESFNNLNLLKDNPNILNIINQNQKNFNSLGSNNFPTKNPPSPNEIIMQLNKNELFNVQSNTNKQEKIPNANDLQNQIINNIILMNNNFNKMTKQNAQRNENKNSIFGVDGQLKQTIVNSNVSNVVNAQSSNINPSETGNITGKVKNNLDKNLLTLINSNNNLKISLHQNAKNDKNINDLNYYDTNVVKESPFKDNFQNYDTNSQNLKFNINNDKSVKNKYGQSNNMQMFDDKFELDHKDSTEMNIEKEIRINPIKNIENNINNICSLNWKMNNNFNSIIGNNTNNQINNLINPQNQINHKTNNNNNTNNGNFNHYNNLQFDQKVINNEIKNQNLPQKFSYVSEEGQTNKIDSNKLNEILKTNSKKNLLLMKSPMSDSDRTMIQFNKDNIGGNNSNIYDYEKQITNRNVLLRERNNLLDNNLLNSGGKSSDLDKTKINYDVVNYELDSVKRNNINGHFEPEGNKLVKIENEIKYGHVNEEDEKNKDKSKCLIF